MKSRVVWVLMAAANVAITIPVQGQQIVTNEHRAPEPGAAQVFAKLVTVDVQNVTLRQALQHVAERSGIRIQYRASAIEAVTRPVSVRATQAPLGTVLGWVLSGTNLHVLPVGTDFVTIASLENEDAARTGVITGKVIQAKTKQGIAGARVFLNDAQQGVTAGEDGTFRLTVPAGEHTIRVRLVGYGHQAKTVMVEQGQTVALEFAMEPSASVLDQVIVTGTVVATERKAIPNPITVITAEEIEKRGITRIEQFFRGEVPGVLAMEMGSSVYSDESPGAMERKAIYSRGVAGLSASSGATPLKTYIDGVELLDPNALGTIDPSSIERIEIVTGPQAATIYGSGAMGGVMQIFTKKGYSGRATEFVGNFKYGMLENNISTGKAPVHSHTLSVTGGTGAEFSYSGNLSYNYSGPWQPYLYSRALAGSIGVTYTRGLLTANGSVSSRLGNNGTGGNGAAVYLREKVETGEWSQQGHYPLSNYIRQRTAQSSAQTLSFNADYRARRNWQHSLTFGSNATEYSITPERPSYVSVTSGEDTLYLLNRSIGKRNSLSYSTTLQSALGIVSSVLTVGGNGSWGNQLSLRGCTVSEEVPAWNNCADWNPVSVNNPLKDKSYGGFGSWRIGLFDQLFLTLGIRGERNPTYGEEHKIDWTPTNGLAYSLSRGDVTIKFLGSYGRATRAPSRDMRLPRFEISSWYDPQVYPSQYGNTMLTPEYSRGPQGGIELYYGNIGSVALNHYQQNITDLLEIILVDSIVLTYVGDGSEYSSQIYQWQNTAKVKQQGWEATGNVTLGPVGLRGTYSWFDSRVETSWWGDLVPGQVFSNVPSHTANLTVSYARGNTSVTLVTNYVGSKIIKEANYELFQNAERNRLRMYADVGRVPSYSNLLWATQKGYYKSDLALSHRINPAASLTLNIVNLANGYGTDGQYYRPTLGRQSLFGVSLRYPR